MPDRYNNGDIIDGKYQVVGDKLGAGGMGAVRKVASLADGSQYALKYCTSTRTETIRRFSREVRAMQQLSHENVIAIIDYNLEHLPPYFVMPLAKGSLLAEVGTLSKNHPAALEAFLQLLEGTKEVHRIGPHRDIKPDNALRKTNDKVAIADFGLIKFESGDSTILTQSGHILGTFLYMAPEQKVPGGSRDADIRADIYALGATLYHLVTGKYPAVLSTSDLRPTLARIIKRATNTDPNDRYQSTEELGDAVAGYLKILTNPDDPQVAFSMCFEKVTKRLTDTGGYDEQEILGLLNSIRGLLENPSTLLEEVDRIPETVILLALHKFPEQVEDALEAYASAIDRAGKNKPYRYADKIGLKMKRIFHQETSPQIKAHAARIILILAVDLRRFPAMDTLASVLLAVTQDEDAIAIARMLREEHARFRGQAQRYRDANIHRLLREEIISFLS